jgi:hypothetical protein
MPKTFRRGYHKWTPEQLNIFQKLCEEHLGAQLPRDVIQ